jgi:pimeloyl-ACP methyl ester carboxylesterase
MPITTISGVDHVPKIQLTSTSWKLSSANTVTSAVSTTATAIRACCPRRLGGFPFAGVGVTCALPVSGRVAMLASYARGVEEVGGRRIETLELEGDEERRPLVLLHEGLGSVGLWRDFPQQLAGATGRRVLAFSRFGHGRSDRPPAPRTPGFFHEEALEVLPELLPLLRAEAPILVGHSDGASIALIHAASHPVEGLVLLAPHVFVEDVTVERIRETREAFATGLRDRMARHHDDPDAAFWGWCDVWLDPAFRAWSLEPEAARVTAPMLLIQGLDDPYGTLEQLDRIEAVAPQAQRLVVPGGHSPHLDAPGVVVSAIASFCERTAAG